MGEFQRIHEHQPNRDTFDLKARIMHESLGHPTSFMILLKLFDECQPTSRSWYGAMKKKTSEIHERDA